MARWIHLGVDETSSSLPARALRGLEKANRRRRLSETDPTPSWRSRGETGIRARCSRGALSPCFPDFLQARPSDLERLPPRRVNGRARRLQRCVEATTLAHRAREHVKLNRTCNGQGWPWPLPFPLPLPPLPLFPPLLPFEPLPQSERAACETSRPFSVLLIRPCATKS